MSFQVKEKKTRWFFSHLIIVILVLLIPTITVIIQVSILDPSTLTPDALIALLSIQVLLSAGGVYLLVYRFYLNFPILTITLKFTPSAIEIFFYDELFFQFDTSRIKELIIERDSWGSKYHHIIQVKPVEGKPVKFRTWDLRMKRSPRKPLIPKIRAYCEEYSIAFERVETKSKPVLEEVTWLPHQMKSFLKENKARSKNPTREKNTTE